MHDFFAPQPEMLSGAGSPAAFILRVILHDWPDAFARRILLQLRRAAYEGNGDGDERQPTYLIIGDHLLPYACTEARTSSETQEGKGSKKEGRKSGEDEEDGKEEEIEGMDKLRTVRGARWPLLANLGKASSNAYWMDMTVCRDSLTSFHFRNLLTLFCRWCGARYTDASHFQRT